MLGAGVVVGVVQAGRSRRRKSKRRLKENIRKREDGYVRRRERATFVMLEYVM